MSQLALELAGPTTPVAADDTDHLDMVLGSDAGAVRWSWGCMDIAEQAMREALDNYDVRRP